MQFPESWLREFCDPQLSTQALAELLTMSGMEVEELKPVAPAFHGIVVAEILEAVQHPNADKLRVCKVDAGAHSPQGPLQIVCGAPNARAGIRVPLALVGAELPPGAVPECAPAATLHTRSLSALGCCTASTISPTTTRLKGGATGRSSSTSMPDMVSSSARACVDNGGSQNSRSQDSGNCMLVRPRLTGTAPGSAGRCRRTAAGR